MQQTMGLLFVIIMIIKIEAFLCDGHITCQKTTVF